MNMIKKDMLEIGKIVSRIINEAYQEKGKVVIGIVGGDLVLPIYNLIPSLDLPLEGVHFMFGDERCTSESNYNIASDMFERLVNKGLPRENIHQFIPKTDEEDFGLFQDFNMSVVV